MRKVINGSLAVAAVVVGALSGGHAVAETETGKKPVLQFAETETGKKPVLQFAETETGKKPVLQIVA
jgi:hypothetical protein